MAQIREFKFRNVGTYNITEQGYIKGAALSVTRAVRPREVFTFFFENKENTPMYDYEINMYNDEDTVDGTYLTSLVRRSGTILHIYYKRKKCQNTLQT